MATASFSKSGKGPSKWKMSDAEWQTRVELAAAFRVAYHYGWNNRVTNHITARVPGEKDRFLMNPAGLGWHEITASNLVTADFDGKTYSHPDAELAPAGFNFHSGILKARADLNCVFHCHATAGIVVSAMKDGLLIVDQTGVALYDEVGYHAFEGYAQENEEVPRILRDLGDKHTLMMWNHGLLTVGASIGEAFSFMRKLIDACELQERLMATGAEIRRIPEEILMFTRKQGLQKRGNKPVSDKDWLMCLRLAEKLDPTFAQ